MDLCLNEAKLANSNEQERFHSYEIFYVVIM